MLKFKYKVFIDLILIFFLANVSDLADPLVIMI